MIGADRKRTLPSCVLPQGVPQGQTESGGIVLAVICWSPSAQRQCGPSRRCAHRPSVASRLSINFSLSLSLSLLILFSLLPENGFPSLATASLATPDPQEAEARPGRKSRRTRRYRPGGGQPYLRALDDRFQPGVPPTDDFGAPWGRGCSMPPQKHGRSCRTPPTLQHLSLNH